MFTADLDRNEISRHIADGFSANRLLELCVENAPAGIAIFDRQMRYLAASRVHVLSLGMGEQQVIGRSHYDVFPGYPERWREIHERCLDGATENADADEILHADGRVEYWRWTISPWRDSAGEVGGLVMCTQNITPRVLAEKSAIAERERIDGMLASVPGLLLQGQYDAFGEWRVTHMVASDIGFAGYDTDELSAFQSFPMEPDMISAQDWDSALQGYQSRWISGTGTLEYRLRHKSGHWAWVRDAASFRKGLEGADLHTIFLQDITEEKEREQRLTTAERLLNMGQMATGIAHELRQPLMSLSLSAEAALLELNKKKPSLDVVRTRLARVMEMVDRQTDIIENVSKLSRGGMERPSVQTIQDMVERASSLVRERAEKCQVTIEQCLAGSLPSVNVPPYLYQNVLASLMNSALEAYEQKPEGSSQGGVIRIEAGFDANGRLILSVKDRAGGIPEDVLPHIFIPFFMTKSHRKGTGIGLAICYAVVRDTGGELIARNEGGGVVFSVLFGNERLVRA
jgi:PAS domain S-box-containing protein